MRRRVAWIGVPLWVALVTVGAAQPPDLSGQWVREGSLGPAMDDVAPAWEEITVLDGAVTIRRASAEATADGVMPTDVTASALPEMHAGDGVERPARRARTDRQCRSRWEAGQFVIECRQTDGGPGGQAPPVFTREVRFVDGDGRLVLKLTWQSEDRIVTRRAVYRRYQP